MKIASSGQVKQKSQDVEDSASLYESYAARVFVYLQYRCNDSATAQDLTAQVFERLLHSLPQYRPERGSMPAWLFSIARHVITDWQRRQYLRQFLPWEAFGQQPSGEPGPEQAALESEERRQLHQALRQLSDRERDVLGLRFASEMTNREIAGLTGLSESNVAVILYRALRKLRQAMDEAQEAGLNQEKICQHTEVEHE